YIFTLRCAAYGEPRGPFSIRSNGREIATQVKIPAFTVKNITWSQWVEDGVSEISFAGDNWAVSSLGVQLLQHSMEDFKFRRGFWRADGFEPHPVNANASFASPVKYAVGISEIPLPQTAITDPAKSPAVPAGEICLPKGDAPEMDWRYNIAIGSLGPANNGTFTEFDTTELIDRRLQERKASGINTLLLNGLLSRHTYPDQLARVQKTITEVSAAGHKKGMRILDHQDVTLFWNMGQGYRVMCAEIGEMQQSIDGNLPLRGFCINNVEFREAYFKWLVDYIKATDIDGIMLDEGTFYQDTFCGCADCRKKFTAETGLVLPMDETSPILFNKNSMIWKAWLQWRMKAVGDFKLNLRQRIMPIKPYFTMMVYTTHGGFSSSWSPLAHGATLNELARSCDFMGTEIMSRNVMAAHRAVFAFRKAKNALRTAFDIPIFGLVYPENSANFAYFGWALNNMNAQVTWELGGRSKNTGTDTKFLDFKDNFDRKNAKPVSEIAMLYPVQSINWAKYMAPTPDVLGASQMLSDKHMMHDMIIEWSLTPAVLKNYRAVMVNSANALSDAQVETLLNYVSNGGTLYLSATSGSCDEMGNDRKEWPFAKALGVDLKVGDGKFKFSPCTSIRFAGKEPIAFSSSAVNFSLDAANPPAVRAEVVDKAGAVIQPLIVEQQYGKGRIIYCAVALGGKNYEIEKSYGSEWDFVLNEPAKDFFIDTVRNVVLKDDKLSFEGIEIPEDVLVSVYSQNVGGTNTTVVNLLNAIATKSMKKPGQKLPAEAPAPAWVNSDKDIVFDITLPSSLTRAFAASPDWSGQQEVSAVSLGKGVYRVTVPKELLKCYTLIKLERSK
ncbi:MAG: beta-galactosidase trimerization domain-containing protein, partial [Verrucomicrobia bacterium]|nr:beta-galactosidase trimerization domain-containing protein [Verrucomicrobiota bacterium]